VIPSRALGLADVFGRVVAVFVSLAGQPFEAAAANGSDGGSNGEDPGGL
jgi:hypothetical protein